MIDYDLFVESFDEQGGTVTTDASFPSNLPEDIQAQAPTIITRMKDAGVTTVVPFVDYTSLRILMEQANAQDFHPEWFFTGALYQDLAITARSYPAEQAQHAFGLGFVYPWTTEETPPAGGVSLTDQLDSLNWYWGQDRGTYTARYNTPILWWLLSGIHAAGPNLTPEDVQAGPVRARRRAAGRATARRTRRWSRSARARGLPYDEYSLTGYDFAPFWWDPETEGPSNGLGTIGKGIGWWVDGATRYSATTWPKKQFAWFDDDTAITHFETRPEPVPQYVGDCDDCPAATGQGNPGAPSDTSIVVKAGGTGSSGA